VTIREFCSGQVEKKPIVLINHSISGTWTDELRTKDFLVEQGFLVLMLTRRGHDELVSNTGGVYNTNGIPEDLKDVIGWIKTKFHSAPI